LLKKGSVQPPGTERLQGHAEVKSLHALTVTCDLALVSLLLFDLHHHIPFTAWWCGVWTEIAL